MQSFAARLHLSSDGCASLKEAPQLPESYFIAQFTQQQSSEYYTHHCKTKELRRRYEWIMQYLFMHAKGDKSAEELYELLG